MIVTETVSPSALTRGPGLVTTGGALVSVTVHTNGAVAVNDPSDTVTTTL